MAGAAYPELTDADLQRTVDLLELKKGSISAVARELGITRPSVRFRLAKAAKRGIASSSKQIETAHGWNPEHDLTKVVPSPLVLRGTSTLYGDDGALKLQWVKTKLSDEKFEQALRAAVAALAEGVPRPDPVPPPENTTAELCNLYTLTDCHVGMRAWAKETGSDWDLAIAERELTAAFDYLVNASPPARVGIVNQLGDFLHFDGLSPVTPTSGHQLDADGRYSKVVEVATRILRHVISQALLRHDEVIVLIAEGNHDIASSVWLRHLFGLLFENEPRVKVIDSVLPYYIHMHGQTLLAFHHGHLKRLDDLPLLFAAQFPAEWGATVKRYCHTGHWHHEHEKEFSGMKVKQHATLAARDAYAARGGWVSERQITGITYHAKHGQVATTTVVPEMLAEAAA